MPKVKTYTFRVNFRENHWDMAGFLDMLRYDQARVDAWGRDTNGIYTVTLKSERYTPDRWSSFGLVTVLATSV